MDEITTALVERTARLRQDEKVALVVQVAISMGGETAEEIEHLLTSLRRNRELDEGKAMALTKEEAFGPLYDEFG